MKKKTIAILIAVVLLLAIVIPVAAITDGELDGDGHPMVGLMVAQQTTYDEEGNIVYDENGDIVYQPLWRCSGTLISENIFITAGHCTEDPADHVELWFDSDVQPLVCPEDSSGNYERGDCYPFKGAYSGIPHTNPKYDPNAFYTNDLGIVELSEGVILSEYGELPTVGRLNEDDIIKQGTKGTRFTAVGYGLQESFPDAASWKEVAFKTRYVAYPFLLNINAGFIKDFSMYLSNNHVSGGTCFGDSGGPNFIEESLVIAGVTSFGMNPRCAGIGGVYRLDRAVDRDWINEFLP